MRTPGAASIGLIPVEAFLFSQGVWQDYEYDACCYLATRRKAQTIRHNVDEMRKLPNLFVPIHMMLRNGGPFVPVMALYTILVVRNQDIQHHWCLRLQSLVVFGLHNVGSPSFISHDCLQWSAQVIDHLGCSFQPIPFEHVPWLAQLSKSDCYLLRLASKDAPNVCMSRMYSLQITHSHRMLSM